MVRETVHIVRSKKATTFHEDASCGVLSGSTATVDQATRAYATEQLGRSACRRCSDGSSERGRTQEDVFKRLGLPRDLAYNPTEGDGGDA